MITLLQVPFLHSLFIRQAGMSSYAEQRAGVQGWGCGVVAVVIVAIATTSRYGGEVGFSFAHVKVSCNTSSLSR